MGTNYYAKLNICPACKRSEDTVHLGKSSIGWVFQFQYNGGKYYKSYPEMIEWLKDKIIENEYGEFISLKDFIDLVKLKQKDRKDSVGSNISIGGYHFLDCEFS